MYLIQYVIRDWEYGAIVQRDEYFDLGYVATEEEAEYICKNFSSNLEYEKVDLYSKEEFIKQNIKWGTNFSITINIKTWEYSTSVHSNPYVEGWENEFYKPYMIDIKQRNYITLSVWYCANEEIKNQDINYKLKFLLKNLKQSKIHMDKWELAKKLFMVLIEDIKKIDKDIKIKEENLEAVGNLL